MFSVPRVQPNEILGPYQRGVCGLHVAGADFAAEHVDRYDG